MRDRGGRYDGWFECGCTAHLLRALLRKVSLATRCQRRQAFLPAIGKQKKPHAIPKNCVGLRFTVERFARLRATNYLTTMTFDVAPSVPLPLNLLLLADSAVPPEIAVVLLKKSLFERRTVPPATLTPITSLANMLFSTLI